MSEPPATTERETPAARPAQGPRRRAGTLAALLLVLAAVGMVWTAAGWGALPGYGDSQHYYSLALRGRTDPFRGWMYPHVVGSLARVEGETSQTAEGYSKFRDRLSESLRKLQVVQLLALAAALAVFVRALRLRAPRPWIGAAVFGALLFDPLVAHYALAMMPDGLALAAALVWCAGAADLLTRRTSPVRASALVVLGHVLGAGLRPERNLVVLAAAVGTWLVVEAIARGRRAAAVGARPRARLLLGLSVLLFAAGIALRPEPSEGQEARWPLRTTLLHQRVVFPYLEDVLDQLPSRERGGLDAVAARFHDAHLVQARAVVDRLQQLQPDVDLSERIRVWASQTWQRHRTAIVLDVLADGVENVLATPTFYAHAGALALGGPQAVYPRHDPATDNTHRIVERLTQEHPAFSRAYLVLAAVVAALAAALALRHPSAAFRGAGLAWLAPLAFVLVNAGAFAATQNLTQVRYTLLAHVAFLVWAYAGALGVQVASGRRAPGATQ